jgi:hypothetical protein
LHAPARHHAPVRIAVDTFVLLAAFVARGLGADCRQKFLRRQRHSTDWARSHDL